MADTDNDQQYNYGDGDPTLDEQMKKEAIGKSCFSFLYLTCSAAFLCGLYANAYCDFASREIIYKPGHNSSSACSELDYDGTAVQPYCETLFSNHGVGFYGWYGTVPVDTQICFDYAQPIPGVGIIEPTFDTKFNSAKAFAITANVLGAFAWFTLSFATCCKLDQEQFLAMNCYFFLATLFQGLTLLIYRSNICELGFFQSYFPNNDLSTFADDVNCGLGLGAKFCISATVLYFVCNTITPMCIVPDPINVCGSRNGNGGGGRGRGGGGADRGAPPPQQQDDNGEPAAAYGGGGGDTEAPPPAGETAGAASPSGGGGGDGDNKSETEEA